MNTTKLLKTTATLKARIVLFLFLALATTTLRAQQSNLTPNEDTPLVSGTFNSLSVTSSKTPIILGVGGDDHFSPKANVIDNDLTKSASWTYPLLGGSAWIEVTDNNATGNEEFPAGSEAGFVFESVGLSLLGNLTITITTYLDGTEQESINKNNLRLLNIGGGKTKTSFLTTKSYDKVRFSVTSPALTGGLLGSMKVYYSFITKYESINNPECNENTMLALPDYPTRINEDRTGVSGIALGGLSNEENVIDGDDETYAEMSLLLNLGTGSVSIAVENMDGAPYTTGTYVGFDISSSEILNLSLLGAITIETYLNGTLQDQYSDSDLIADVGLLSGEGRSTVGFIATKDFDEARIIATNEIIGLELGVTKVYGLVVKEFCEGDPLLVNSPTYLTTPEYPVHINKVKSGILGIGVGASTSNLNNILSSDPEEYATIDIPVSLEAITTSSISVIKELDPFPENSYAGFEISTGSLLNADVLSNYTIKLLKDGVEVQSASGSNILIDANTSLLTGTSRQVLGIIAEDEYDEIVLEIAQPVNVDLGEIRVYNAQVTKFSPYTLSCYESTLLQHGIHPVIVNHLRTGVLGVLDVGSSVNNPQNVLNQDNNEYAEIITVAGVLSNTALSVLNPFQTYPTGTFAGFVVENKEGLIDVDLLKAITINTYLDGTLQESISGSALLNLTLIVELIGPGSYVQNLGFYTNYPFDELQITVGETVTVDVASTFRVYGAFVDTRTSMGDGLLCMVTAPDFAVGYLNEEINGDVGTNDRIPSGVTYALNSSSSENPDNSVPTVNEDGTYSFTGTEEGTYVFEIAVCLAHEEDNCYTERLTITVIDPDEEDKRIPIANDDVVMTEGNEGTPSPITIDVLANDRPHPLDGPTLFTDDPDLAPQNGTIMLVGDKIVYTPDAGFYGVDQFTYEVTVPGTNNTAQATVTVIVLEGDVPNTTFAADYFNVTTVNTPVIVEASEGVLTNATDKEGHAQAAIPSTKTIEGKGSFEIFSDGSYEYYPAQDFIGSVQFTYKIEDTGTPVAEAEGTIHILVLGQNSPLPLTLTSLDVWQKSCDEVVLNWTTMEEFNVSHFEVQFSYDQKTYHLAKEVAANNRISTNLYKESVFLPRKNRNIYLRLKMIDKDGAFEYSNIKRLKLHCTDSKILAYPNPAQDNFILTGLNGSESIRLYDNLGRLVLEEKTGENQRMMIEIDNLHPGLYQIIILDQFNSMKETIKFIKEN